MGNGDNGIKVNSVQRGFFAAQNPITIMNYVKMAIMATVIIILAFAAFRIIGLFRTPDVNKPVINVANLHSRIVSIGELATLQYDYRTLIRHNDSRQIFGWNVPLTQKSYIIMVDGTMKIGIDASELAINVSEQTNTITIIIPNAKILSHELFAHSMEILDESSGLFNRISINDWATMEDAEKEAMVKIATEKDLFIRAENDAVRMFQALIEGIVPDDYIVNITRRR
jgi:hypothetical protein